MAEHHEALGEQAGDGCPGPRLGVGGGFGVHRRPRQRDVVGERLVGTVGGVRRGQRGDDPRRPALVVALGELLPDPQAALHRGGVVAPTRPPRLVPEVPAPRDLVRRQLGLVGVDVELVGVDAHPQLGVGGVDHEAGLDAQRQEHDRQGDVREAPEQEQLVRSSVTGRHGRVTRSVSGRAMRNERCSVIAAMCPLLVAHSIAPTRWPARRPSSGRWTSAAERGVVGDDVAPREVVPAVDRGELATGLGRRVEAEAGLGRLLLEDDEPALGGELRRRQAEADERHVRPELAAEQRQHALAARLLRRGRAGEVDDRAGVAGEQLAAHEHDEVPVGARHEVRAERRCPATTRAAAGAGRTRADRSRPAARRRGTTCCARRSGTPARGARGSSRG